MYFLCRCEVSTSRQLHYNTHIMDDFPLRSWVQIIIHFLKYQWNVYYVTGWGREAQKRVIFAFTHQGLAIWNKERSSILERSTAQSSSSTSSVPNFLPDSVVFCLLLSPENCTQCVSVEALLFFLCLLFCCEGVIKLRSREPYIPPSLLVWSPYTWVQPSCLLKPLPSFLIFSTGRSVDSKNGENMQLKVKIHASFLCKKIKIKYTCLLQPKSQREVSVVCHSH